MEDIENDKMIYWIIFFVVLIFLAVFGYKFVFSYADEKKQKEEDKTILDEVNMDNYLGVWQFYAGNEVLLQEIVIGVVDGVTITFDYYIDGGIYFESQTANLVNDTATFEIFERDGNGKANGKLVFKNDKIYLIISSTDIDEVNAGTYEFNVRCEESELKDF